jgi:hypothetical protein
VDTALFAEPSRSCAEGDSIEAHCSCVSPQRGLQQAATNLTEPSRPCQTVFARSIAGSASRWHVTDQVDVS